MLSVLNFMLTRYVGKKRLQFISTCILLFFPWEIFISRILSVFGGNSNRGGVARILIGVIVFSPNFGFPVYDNHYPIENTRYSKNNIHIILHVQQLLLSFNHELIITLVLDMSSTHFSN